MKKLKSYEDFKKNRNNEPSESKITENLHKSVIIKPKKINESAFKVGDDYKVKITFDIPINLIQEYIKKVQTETGKNALDNFSESELAEQMVHYVLKHNINIDQIPSAVAVGEETTSEQTNLHAEEDAKELGNEYSDKSDADSSLNTIEEKPETEHDNIDINDSDLNLSKEDNNNPTTIVTEPEHEEEGEDLPLEDNDDTLNLDSEEVDLGEEREIQPEKSQSEEEEEYEEIDLPNDETIVSEENVKPIHDMIFFLRNHGIDTFGLSNEEIVDMYNEIAKENIAGVDDLGIIIKPSFNSNIISDQDDSDLY